VAGSPLQPNKEEEVVNMKVRTLIAVAICGLMFASLPSCVSSGRQIDQGRVSEIKKGRTTETDLVQMFGPPNNRSIDSDGNTRLTWTYYEMQMDGKSFIPIAGAFIGSSNQKSQHLEVTLGSDGKVQNFSSTTGGSASHRGTP
jgi:outer membrane protein assembly factor BamE (lipoprotein component of BamABCDE complex)